MLSCEIDGKAVQVPPGSTVMDAAVRVGAFVPHFCWHRKLSIAANCRMCLVEVEKAPKALPACATPVTEGMRVWTHSEAAVKAQKAVMEFLLINHPLDCPICDQGGECQLQDLAVGYGGSTSRYAEEKRVVASKDIGPLVAAEEMNRCIHCTRCVRFGQEIAGVMELGMGGRGEHSEIMAFVGRAVDSELSGNMIDLCPVGALTSKPFRYAARTWELARRRSVSPHDALGANLIVQSRQDRVLRVLPLENEAINECWISDRDRFSYEGLGVDRLEQPMLREAGGWREVDWAQALDRVAQGLRGVVERHGPAALGALASPVATLEELHLLQKLVRALGSENVDFRLRQSDFSGDATRVGAPWLGLPVADLSGLDRVLVAGSFLRKDHPLIAQRLRQAARKGARIVLVHCADDDPLMPLAARAIVPPGALPHTLAEVLVALCAATGRAAPSALGAVQAGEPARACAAALAGGERVAVLMGNLAAQHPRREAIAATLAAIAQAAGGRFGSLGEGANAVGGYLAGAWPQGRGLDARAMLEQPRRAYLLLHAEPDLDFGDPARAREALGAAELVVALTPFRGAFPEHAHVLLPVTPFTETSGTFVNCEGRVQSFNGAVRPLAAARPAWKVLRVLGTLLGVPGFGHESAEAVREEALGPAGGEVSARLSNATASVTEAAVPPQGEGLERVAEVPIHDADPLVRRAGSLRLTRDAQLPAALRLCAEDLARLGLEAGRAARVHQGRGSALLTVMRDDSVPPGCARVATARPETAGLGPMFGQVRVEPA